jgi:hypothetical protein
MTTTKSRINRIKTVLECLLEKQFDDKEENTCVDFVLRLHLHENIIGIPKFITQLQLKHPTIFHVITEGKDYGPITKVIPLILDDTISKDFKKDWVITVDDDIQYNSAFIEDIHAYVNGIDISKHRPCFSLSCLNWNIQLNTFSVCEYDNHQTDVSERNHMVLEGYMGNVFPLDVFYSSGCDFMTYIQNTTLAHLCCFESDDVVLSYFCILKKWPIHQANYQHMNKALFWKKRERFLTRHAMKTPLHTSNKNFSKYIMACNMIKLEYPLIF